MKYLSIAGIGFGLLVLVLVLTLKHCLLENLQTPVLIQILYYILNHYNFTKIVHVFIGSSAAAQFCSLGDLAKPNISPGECHKC